MHTRTQVFVALAAVALASCATSDAPPPPNTLVVAKVAAAPALDGVATDAAWASARPLTVKLGGGANFGGSGETTATLKAVTSGDMIYFLLQYADPTNSIRRGPFQKQADGTWKKLSDPNDKGGDDNVYYEDKWSIIWNVNDSIAGFNQNGCAVFCHVGEGKPFGNKYTSKAGEIGDMWHMKGSRNGVWGQVDDQYVDDTRFDKDKSPNAGRKGDPGGPDYKSFGLVNGKPEFMNKDGKAANAGGTFYIKDGDQVAFDDSKFKAGDEVASYFVYQLKGDRADIGVAYRWANGTWTYEIARKLTTGSQYDIQFGDMGKTYTFGLSAFDNAQVRHAVGYEPLKLVFAK
jgi:Ethylbenzene dehydrogenase